MSIVKQLSIFDEIRHPGDWINCKGKRVSFENISPGKMYIQEFDNLACPDKCRVLKATRKTKDLVFLTDGSLIANQGYMMMSRQEIDGNEGGIDWLYEID